MKRFLAAITAALATAALAGPPAVSAAPPTLAQLSRKINTLQQKVTRLERRVATLEADLTSCLSAWPFAQFGGSATEGYLYYVSQTDTYLYASAINLVGDTAGLVPGRDFFYLAEMDPTCVVAAGRAQVPSDGRLFQRLGVLPSLNILTWMRLRNR
jgi:hypothetical protein